MQRLRYQEPFLACLRRKVFRSCPAEQAKLRRTYAEVHVPSGTLCIVQLPQQCVRLLWLQRREVTVVAPVGEPWDHATLPMCFLLSLVRACCQALSLIRIRKSYSSFCFNFYSIGMPGFQLSLGIDCLNLCIKDFICYWI